MSTSITRRMKLGVALLAAAFVLPLSACSANSGLPTGADLRSVAPADTNEMWDGAPEESADSAGPGSSGAEYGTSIVRTGEIVLEVVSIEESADEVSEVATDLGGFVASRSITEGDEWTSAGATLLLRVPAGRFDDAFEALNDVGNVLTQHSSADDVSAQHVDLEARVAALQASVERLTELMSGAASTGELIEAEAALSERQQELDGLRAQLETLEDQVAHATISVTLGTEPTALPGGPTNFWEGLLAGFGSLGTAGSGALVVFGILLPWLLVSGVIALGVVWLVRGVTRRRARRAASVGSRDEAQAQ